MMTDFLPTGLQRFDAEVFSTAMRTHDVYKLSFSATHDIRQNDDNPYFIGQFYVRFGNQHEIAYDEIQDLKDGEKPFLTIRELKLLTVAAAKVTFENGIAKKRIELQNAGGAPPSGQKVDRNLVQLTEENCAFFYDYDQLILPPERPIVSAVMDRGSGFNYNRILQMQPLLSSESKLDWRAKRQDMLIKMNTDKKAVTLRNDALRIRVSPSYEQKNDK